MLLDTVGVAIAASDDKPGNQVLDAVRRIQGATIDGEAVVSVIGTNVTSDPATAALLTGVNAHAYDFDDVHYVLGGHPSAPVLAAVLPLAERDGVSGRKIRQAFAVGVEVETRLGEVLNPPHYERGGHPTAVIGTVGSAVATGTLLGLKSVS